MSLALFLPYAKLIAVFTLMLLGMRCRLGLGLSVLLGSLCIALLFGCSVPDWLRLAGGVFQDSVILTVWGVVALVLALSALMESSGQAERFMNALSLRVSSPAARLVFFPILIGLLPMPGGAVFSAPMITAVTKNLHVPEVDKSLVNYWFRHVAELSWPLYPAVILAASFAGISTALLGVWTFPLTLACFGVGWLFLIRPLSMPAAMTAAATSEEGRWSNILRQGAPIFISLAGALLLEAVFACTSIPMDYGILFALAAGLLCCLRQNGLGIGDFCRTLVRPHVLKMLFMIGALGVFKNVLSQGGVAQSIIDAGSGDAAIWLLATVLSALMGLLTGMLVACVGAVAPLLLVMVESAYGPGHALPWLTLCMISGAAGYMASPLHICFVLSCQYFKVDMATAWRRMPLPALAYWLCGFVYFLLLWKLTS